MDVRELPDHELADLLGAVQREMARRAQVEGAPVCYSLSLYAGNSKAGAKAWAKHITAIDPSQPNGFGVEGPWAPRSGALPAGSYLLLGGKGGSRRTATKSYALVRVRRGETFEHSAGYQEFSGRGLELVATSADELPEQAILDQHPELAPCVGQPLFPIYAALRAVGF
jgi:hypothetical protein